ncbi:methylenetetrahydrofolate reductase [Aestuariivirga sp.]|uniref:methylenetetrahydrofolate reductase n=1 Tax=Aestuariivirga sp. TaxID=2650926 RepID=UPI0025B8CC10|nr:methylenetetrahydrofolate reductase [Aestuariivirga sp.]MCA3555321.1 methylenetetrahydrofolate reductase [Aestuariivirga sp.]
MNAPIANTGSSTASFLRLSSIEITPKQVEKLPLLKEKLVPGARVFVALIDAGDVAAQIEAARQLKAAGFQPVPHVPARFVTDEADLRTRIKAFAGAGSDTMLVLGGGAPEPIGQYDAAIQLMRTGVFEANGVRSLGIAGHPEGNPDIARAHGEAALMNALKEKQAYLRANGLQGFIATQFLFEVGPVTEWAKTLRAEGIDLPIHVGIPGPATIKTLVKYAAMCGVGNSARFIRKQALNIARLLSVSTPDDFVAGLAQVHYGQPELGIAGPHLYPFGGFDKLFDWMKTVT